MSCKERNTTIGIVEITTVTSKLGTTHNGDGRYSLAWGFGPCGGLYRIRPPHGSGGRPAWRPATKHEVDCTLKSCTGGAPKAVQEILQKKIEDGMKYGDSREMAEMSVREEAEGYWERGRAGSIPRRSH